MLELQPDHEWALNNLGHCLNQLKEYDAAIHVLERAIAVNANHEMAHNNLVASYVDSDRKHAAIPWRRRLTTINPKVGRYPFDLANALLSAGRVSEAIHYYRRALELQPNNKAGISNYLLALNYDDGETVDSVAQEHFRLAKRRQPGKQPSISFPQSKNADRKLRVGYVSGDFAQHPVGKISQAVFRAHNRTRFEVVAYHDSRSDDAWTKLVRENVDRFTPIIGRSDDDVETLMRNDEIDILVELTGHTGGRNRLRVLARRVAPLQISFLGYPTTTGLAEIDYRLTDAYCDPPGETEHLHSETLVRLSRGFLCFEPPKYTPSTTTAPCTQNGYVTFGSFNNPSKISPSALRAWAQILNEVEGSRLAVKYGGSFAGDWICERWREHFASHGVAPERLEFQGPIPTIPGHLNAIAAVDVALDPFPYQGTTTTLETLTAGVPVVTLAGETYARRASSALLWRLGFDELVTSTVEDYVQTAVSLASDEPKLTGLRAQIRETFLQSEIVDVRGFVRELEETFADLWRQWCASSASEIVTKQAQPNRSSAA